MENADSPNNTECPICFDIITNPVTLPCCEYRFCMKCLESWRHGLEHCVNGDRTCPCCRELIPPTLDEFRTIQFYKRVSISLNIHLLRDESANLPLPPFSNVEHLGPVAIRHYYRDMETTYGYRVRIFEQKYGFDFRNAIPSSPPQPIYLPNSVVQGVRVENFLEVRKFLGSLPIPPQRLNATSRDNGDTLLHIAVQANCHEIVKILLALGAEVNATNGDNLTPLHFAVRLQGHDDSIAKTLIRWGAKKVSMILSNSSAPAGVDSFLAAAADALGKSDLARMLESEAIGRHCKFQVDGIAKRGTIVKDDSVAHYQILLDDSNDSAIVIKHSVDISKPLLFDFRGIDRAVLFPTPRPRQMDPPGRRRQFRYGTERMSSSQNNSRQRLAQLIRGVDTTTMTSQAIIRLHQRAVETIQAMDYSQNMAREVLRIHQDISSFQGFEASVASRTFTHHMRNSIAAREDDIESLRDATDMLRRRVERLRQSQRAQDGNSVASRGQGRGGIHNNA